MCLGGGGEAAFITRELCGPYDDRASKASPQASVSLMSRDGFLDSSPCSSCSDGDAQVHKYIQGGELGRQPSPQSL